MSWKTITTLSAAFILILLALRSQPPASHPSQATATPTPPEQTESSSPTPAPSTEAEPDSDLIPPDTDDFNQPANLSAKPQQSAPAPTPRTAGIQEQRNIQPNGAPSTPPAHDEDLVSRVIDGDTFELATGQTVRLIGIDTPESVHPRQPVECFGKEAASYLRQLIEDKQVRLEQDVSNTDRYGRLLRYAYLGNLFINNHLVAQGYATASSFPPDIKHQEVFRASEHRARTIQTGLWQTCQTATPPPVGEPPPANPDCQIKGNINSTNDKIYHLPACPYYSRTSINPARGERYFCSESEATDAGWRRAQNCP